MAGLAWFVWSVAGGPVQAAAPGANQHGADPPAAIVAVAGGTFAEELAARELRRYIYLRTGELLPVVESVAAATGPLIVVGAKDRPAITALPCDAACKARIAGLRSEEYLLKSIRPAERPMLLVIGGDPLGTLYGAYAVAEKLGVRFYLHGDVVPERQHVFALPELDESRKPLFALRGIQPFHDFPEGPDWWSRDGYKAVLGQLPKLGMNFFGLHTYPEGGVGPEPLVWIGPPDEVAADGKVKASYPSRHFTTTNPTGAWGYRPGSTGGYHFGAADLFDRDDFGADYQRDTSPWTKMDADQCNDLFDRMGGMLGDTFGFARMLGIKTCLGTETPLAIPAQVKQRLQAAGKNPADPAVVQEIYEGMLQRIAKVHPLDYYWVWTPEGWTWDAVSQQQIDATMADLRALLAAANKVKPPFTLATCGWVLGPPQTPALFDDFLPKDMPMSCISRTVGNTPVEPGFAKVAGRPKWAIPWLEDDPAITSPQLWAGRMRRDAAAALEYGCTGLMGIHWRTRILGPNVSALAKAAWDQTGWNTAVPGTAGGSKPKPAEEAAGKTRALPVADFYADWTRAEFGPEAARPIAALFARLDGSLPRPADWVGGPGSIRPDAAPWNEVLQAYGFVDELAAQRPKITGAGNLERFDYWLNNFRYLRSIAELRCVWGRYNAAIDKAKAEPDAGRKKQLARELALPVRKELVAAFAGMQKHLLNTVTNPGEMGNICNWQQHTLPVVLTEPGRELAGLLGEELPADAMPSNQYAGEPRVFVPEVRTAIVAGDPLKLTVIVLGATPQTAELCWRPLGSGDYARVPLTHVARGVYTVALPAGALKADFEYYVQVSAGQQKLLFPATGEALPQSVVVCGKL